MTERVMIVRILEADARWLLHHAEAQRERDRGAPAGAAWSRIHTALHVASFRERTET